MGFALHHLMSMISCISTNNVYKVVKDRSLITCGEGVEDILTYLMEFSSPLSDLCNYFDPHSKFEKLHSPSFRMLFIFNPLPSECAEFWSHLPDIFHSLRWKN